MVYRDATLVWSARTTVAPVFVGVTAFGGLRGLVVSMSHVGEILVSYMGTVRAGAPPPRGVGGLSWRCLWCREPRTSPARACVARP
jgi:hypothetical protein